MPESTAENRKGEKKLPQLNMPCVLCIIMSPIKR